MVSHRRNLFLILIILTLVGAVPAWAQGNSGAVLSLVVSGGAQQGDTIRISSQVRADTRIQRSNLFYQVLAPDGVTVVATNQTSAPRGMQPGDTFNHGWNTNNSSFPSQGTYSVTLCWSTGNAKNCDIASATTNFYSVPTLGWTLSLVAVGLIAYWVFKHRLEFARTT
jgi:hypothetical protein